MKIPDKILIIGCCLLIVGVFAPVVNLPIVGGVNVLSFDSPLAGAIIGISLCLLVASSMSWNLVVYILGSANLGILAYVLYKVFQIYEKASFGKPSDLFGFNLMVSLDLGVPILVIGAALVAIGGIKSMQA